MGDELGPKGELARIAAEEDLGWPPEYAVDHSVALKEWDLSPQTHYILRRGGYVTASDVLDADVWQLLRLEGFGTVALYELIRAAEDLRVDTADPQIRRAGRSSRSPSAPSRPALRLAPALKPADSRAKADRGAKAARRARAGPAHRKRQARRTAGGRRSTSRAIASPRSAIGRRRREESGVGTISEADLYAELLEADLSHLALDDRVLYSLHAAQMETIGDLARMSAAELGALAELDGWPIEEALAALATVGLEPGEHDDRPALHDRARRPSAGRQRAVVIVAMRHQGATLSEIGERFNVTRERARQILKQTGHVVDVSSVRQRRRVEEALVHSEVLKACYRSGARLERVAKTLGLTARAARAALEHELTAVDRAERRQSMRTTARLQFSDEELLAMIRWVASELEHTPSSKEYMELAQYRGLPSLATIAARFDTWGVAVRAAGLQPAGRGRGNYHRRWTEEACWEALDQVFDVLGDPPALRRYEKLAQADEDLPSPATIRNRLGKWSWICAEVLRRRERRA